MFNKKKMLKVRFYPQQRSKWVIFIEFYFLSFILNAKPTIRVFYFLQL